MRRTPFVTLFAAGALVLTACGGDNSGTATTTAAAATAAAVATTAAAAGTIAATTNPNSVESVTEKATAALLAAGDVGAGFATDTFSPNDPNVPGVCGEPSIDASVPPGVHVGTVVMNATTQQALLEEVRVYTDEEEAMAAYNAALAAINCTTGSIKLDDGTTQPVTISDPIDVAGEVGGDEATGWQLSGADTQGVAMIVRLRAAIVTFQFQAPAGSEATDPAPLDVATLGVARVSAA